MFNANCIDPLQQNKNRKKKTVQNPTTILDILYPAKYDDSGILRCDRETMKKMKEKEINAEINNDRIKTNLMR